MNRIRLLPEQVANQIAAGEVIERPASVVKELVENSLDAQASRVDVEIQAGGRSVVRVTDNGLGMSRDDALLCLERHATSKIQRAEDLAAIATMGFRGEALPSIASVSRFTLITRERESSSPEGTQVLLAAGKILEVKAAGTAPGTMVEVRQLFFNLPARRKFLRTEETESAHIQHYLTLAALSFPEVGFTFHKDGRLVWQLPVVKAAGDVAAQLGALRERLRALYGSEQKLVPVDFLARFADLYEGAGKSNVRSSEGDSEFGVRSSDFHIWGFIGAPGVSRATREDQHLFVNRRPVENRGLNFALLEGYHTALMKGRYPVCCLFIDLAPGAVDVNVHPAKREVKFHRESQVRSWVGQAVRQALLQFHSGRRPGSGGGVEADGGARLPASSDVSRPTASIEFPSQNVLPNFPSALQPQPVQGAHGSAQRPLPMGFGTARPSLTPAGLTVPGPEAAHQPRPGDRVPSRPTAPAEPSAVPDTPPPRTAATERAAASARPPAASPLLEVPLRLVGVIGKLYVVLESDRGLVLLDQHAAHERILFEQMLNRLEEHVTAPSQKLLLPQTVELSARDANFLREQLPALHRLGVGLSEFGERTFLLDSLPPFIKASDPREFVIELLDQLKAAGLEVNTLRLGEHMVAKTVCRHAVKARDPLAGAELEALIEDLRACAMPYTCPHGRPTLIEMNFRELEKKFGRAQ